MTNTPRDISEGATSVVGSRALTFGRDGGSEETLARRTVCTLELGADTGVRSTNSVGASVQSVLIGGVIIDEFDDIDLWEESVSECWFGGNQEEVVTSPVFGHDGLQIKIPDQFCASKNIGDAGDIPNS